MCVLQCIHVVSLFAWWLHGLAAAACERKFPPSRLLLRCRRLLWLRPPIAHDLQVLHAGATTENHLREGRCGGWRGERGEHEAHMSKRSKSRIDA